MDGRNSVSRGMLLHIELVTLGNKNRFHLDLDSSDMVIDAKMQVYDSHGIDPAICAILKNSRRMKDRSTFAEHRIADGESLQYMVGYQKPEKMKLPPRGMSDAPLEATDVKRLRELYLASTGTDSMGGPNDQGIDQE
jgi:hypothetical protein